MELMRRICVCALLAAGMAGVAGAQTTSTAPAPKPAPSTSSSTADDGFHVSVAPYLWLAGMSGTVGANGFETTVHESAGDVLSYFNFGLMGAADMRYKRLVMPVDFMWVKLSDDKGAPITEDVDSVKIKLNEDIFTPKMGYRIVDKPNVKIDGLAGLRYWHVGTTLTLQPNPIEGGIYQALNWVDALGGGRFIFQLTPKVSVTVAGDAGGGGANSDYQVVGLFGYKLKKVDLLAGYRYLDVNYRPSTGAVLDLHQSGVIFGVNIPLK